MSAIDVAAPRPRWERRKEARPAEIISAALDLFVERGYANARAEDVAARAGISKGTLYLYFANKEELFKAVVRENIVPTIAEAESMVATHQGPTPELLKEVFWGWWDKLGATRLSGITKLVMAESGNFPEITSFYVEEVIERGNRMFISLLERGISRGEFRAVDVESMVNVMVAPVVMLMMWKHSFGPCGTRDVDPRRTIASLVDLFTHGLAAAPRAPKAAT